MCGLRCCKCSNNNYLPPCLYGNREASAIVSAANKFHYYLYGRNFQIATNTNLYRVCCRFTTKLLQAFFPRKLRRNVLLSAYCDTLLFQANKYIADVDCLGLVLTEERIFSISFINSDTTLLFMLLV